MAKRSASSSRWLDEHKSDEFVLKAQREGFRSRAVYKLMEIDDKDHIIKPGYAVVDLGAAPGGWTQVATERLQGRGRIVALDILPMDPLPDVEFIQGDFREEAVFQSLMDAIGEQKINLVMSDMAPNHSGVKAVDIPRAMYLCELALDMARQVLPPGGNFLVKVFQGSGFEDYLKDMRGSFRSVVTRKPKASRSRSKEIYLLGKDFKG